MFKMVITGRIPSTYVYGNEEQTEEPVVSEQKVEEPAAIEPEPTPAPKKRTRKKKEEVTNNDVS